jgi:hypothetical protein
MLALQRNAGRPLDSMDPTLDVDPVSSRRAIWYLSGNSGLDYSQIGKS